MELPAAEKENNGKISQVVFLVSHKLFTFVRNLVHSQLLSMTIGRVWAVLMHY